MSQAIYFRKDRRGFPIVGSNLKATRRPSSAHTKAGGVINGPVVNSLKPSFAGTNRYFVLFSETTGDIVGRSLVVSSTVPENAPANTYYMEIFKNNLIALPTGDLQDSGFIFEDVEQLILDEVIEPPIVLISEDYAQNGYRG